MTVQTASQATMTMMASAPDSAYRKCPEPGPPTPPVTPGNPAAGVNMRIHPASIGRRR